MKAAKLRMIGATLAAGLALTASAWAVDNSDANAARKAHRSEGLILTNARIYTMDGQNRVVLLRVPATFAPLAT